MYIKGHLTKNLQSNPLKLALASCLFVTAYTVFFSVVMSGSVYVCIMDAAFIWGMVYLVIGMSFYIHNIGLFKTFRYWGYRSSVRKHTKEAAYDAKPMDLAAFTEYIMSMPKKPTALFLIAGGVMLAITALLTILYVAF